MVIQGPAYGLCHLPVAWMPGARTQVLGCTFRASSSLPTGLMVWPRWSQQRRPSQVGRQLANTVRWGIPSCHSTIPADFCVNP